VWLALGRCITMTIAEIENRHARNNKRSHALSSWTRFCSAYVAQEAIILQRARHGLRRLLSASGTRLTQALPSAVSPSRSPTLDHVMDVQRRQTGFEMFRREFLAQERLLGRTHKVASAQFWGLLNAKWAALPDSARMEYCQNGEDTAPVALCNRMLVRSRGRTAGESPGPEVELASSAAAHAAVSQHGPAGGPPHVRHGLVGGHDAVAASATGRRVAASARACCRPDVGAASLHERRRGGLHTVVVHACAGIQKRCGKIRDPSPRDV
jgi:hypothetical protein